MKISSIFVNLAQFVFVRKSIVVWPVFTLFFVANVYGRCTLKITRILLSSSELGPVVGATSTLKAAVFVDGFESGKVRVSIGEQSSILDLSQPTHQRFALFQLQADASTQTVSAEALDGSCEKATQTFTLPAPSLPSVPCTGAGSIGGAVFQDLNANGVRESYEPGLEKIGVQIDDSLGNTLGFARTDKAGNWSYDELPQGKAVLVSLLNAPEHMYSSVLGPDNEGGNVQIAIVGKSCDVRFALFHPHTYQEAAPWVATTLFVTGDPTLAGSSAEAPALVALPYKPGDKHARKTLAKAKEIGSAWGVAYNRITGTMFTSALLKRHAGLGPDGLGAIYKINLVQSAADIQSDVYPYTQIDERWGIAVGADRVASRDLSASFNLPSRDSLVFDQVGKVGLGGMCISGDADSIFVVNLYKKSLLIVLNNPMSNTPVNVREIALPKPTGVSPEDWRPWAVAYRGGKIYVGGVCTAQSDQVTDNLKAVVYEYNPESRAFREVLSIPLNYPISNVFPALKSIPPQCKRWNPWTDDFSKLIASGTELCYPQPMLTDIELDIKGNMILVIGDRTGHQAGWGNQGTSAALHGATLYRSNIAGDVLRALPMGEYWLPEKNIRHAKAQGGATLHHGANELLLNILHPTLANAGARIHYDLEGDESKKVYTCYNPTSPEDRAGFGRAAAMGDLVCLGKGPKVHIGRLVWNDENKNGILDPGEKPLQGVKIGLYDSGGKRIAGAVTNEKGFYSFEVFPQTPYDVVVGEGQFLNDKLYLHGEEYLLSPKGQGYNDYTDSDAALHTSAVPKVLQRVPLVSLVSGIAGENGFMYDVGFFALPPVEAPETVIASIQAEAPALLEPVTMDLSFVPVSRGMDMAITPASVLPEAEAQTYDIIPNSGTNELMLRTKNPEVGMHLIKFYDVEGRIAHQMEVENISTVRVIDTKKIGVGLYVVEILRPSGKKVVTRLEIIQ